MEFTLNELSPQHFAFEYKKDGEKLAEIEWVQKENVMVMNHTYVSDVLRGQGVAKKLLDQAASYARENGYKMEAVCSYVVAAFDKSNEYDDIKA
ncbi:acetyltransferase [Ureibacillus massiliensis 4400831 = CIP 108448 = CCUG 49529]|uniref:Acetyltransferase n=1 Tax=Ureibacillus massiliensis 4400831 = CIP 108448 = CCUG 49529 TaxID=1211035 RepID=A0A0A3J9I9_9BACL|nr:GNAT family N-acetyltransferase [Ureibacillus massiliensis]KGR91813.1 acetyltransferase [Ureibacillus massiliensis 4400831 = CIP 108448 = CCUG 49529]